MATTVEYGLGSFVMDVAGQAVPSNGGAGSVKNPEGVDLIVTGAKVLVETPSVGAANLDVGIGVALADSTNLVNALAVNGSIDGKAYNGPAPAAKAECVVWGADEYLNATVSAASAAFVGKVYVSYVRTA